MWNATLEGTTHRFHLAGISNQNFLMRDEATGSWWQQSTGEAVLGPLRGARLEGAPYDELTFATWRAENPDGRVLAPDAAALEAGHYADADWESHVAELPVVTPVDPADPFAPREVVVGVRLGGVSRAYALAAIREDRVVQDSLGGVPVALVMGDDDKSVRCFEARATSAQALELELFAKPEATPLRLVDAQTGSEWDFTGTAVSGPLEGQRLVRVPTYVSYWFDWKQQNAGTGAWLPAPPPLAPPDEP